MRRLQRRPGPDSDVSAERSPSGLRRVRGLARAACLVTAALATATAAAEPLKEGQLPNWIPSLGVGFGIQSRDVHGRIDNPSNPFSFLSGINPLFGGALLPTGVPIEEPTYFCRPSGQFTGYCFFYDDATEAVDGATLPLGGQLIGPPEPFLGLVRPFVQGSFSLDFDRRVVASSGLKPGGFPASGSLPKLRIQVEAEPVSTWWAGGGLAVQVPIDRPLFVKFGYNYSQQKMNLEGTIWRGISINNQDTTQRLDSKDSLTITGWGPSFGLEAEVWRIGTVAMNLSADFLIFFPGSGTDTAFQVNSPRAPGEAPYCASVPNPPSNCIQPAFLTIGADETQYHGSLSLRFTWLGIPY